MLRYYFAEVRTEEDRQYRFMAIKRTSKVVFAELHPRAKQMVAAEFLRRVFDKLPYKGHTVLTDNGVQFNPASASVFAEWAPFRPHLPRIRRGAPAHQARPPVDEQLGLAHESHD